MSQDNIDSLIGNLSEELEPVKPMLHPALRVLPWLIAAALYVAYIVYFTGIRHDAVEKLSDPIFLFEIILPGIIALSAAFASAFLSVPDMRGQKWLVSTTLTATAVFALWSLLRFIGEDMYMPNITLDHCMGEGMYMVVVPIVVLLFLMKRGTTTKPILMGLMNVVSVAGLGYIGLRFTCAMDTVGHATISHLIPYLVLGAILGSLARRLYKW